MSCSTAAPRPVASSSQLQQQHDPTPQPPPPSSNTFQLLPPSLTEILDAFSKNGGGDRELLLAILSAKRAEEDVSVVQVFSLSVVGLFLTSSVLSWICFSCVVLSAPGLFPLLSNPTLPPPAISTSTTVPYDPSNPSPPSNEPPRHTSLALLPFLLVVLFFHLGQPRTFHPSSLP
ncbi:hypothetical protein BDY24DRAFT_389532 [Mrakia frigida]|uniref:uncharacterized protein n=1 Tax=Mrakia frigida TaxID=29902 RepID=UPI003FCC256B